MRNLINSAHEVQPRCHERYEIKFICRYFRSEINFSIQFQQKSNLLVICDLIRGASRK